MTVEVGGREEFEIGVDGLVIRGTSEGEGPPAILCHGLSATRDYVVHGSRSIQRSGRTLHLWDARGHGVSDAPADGGGYGYPEQVGDLDAVISERAGNGPVVVGGHSMGCHTALAWSLANPERVSALILIGPVFDAPGMGQPEDRWDERATVLEDEGPEGFADLVADEFEGSEEERETVRRIALERTLHHARPEAVAQALREVPRSKPFESLSQLEGLSMPSLVVGSHDEWDPGHPLAVAEAWAAALPDAELIVEDPGESPLAWQGGRLSREVVRFLDGCAATGRGS